MTGSSDSLVMVQKYVLFSDFCSSTSIIEDLVRTESQDRWRNLLIDVKQFLCDEKDKANFDIYKFVGDGWILLYPIDFPAKDMFAIMKRMCQKYDDVFRARIRKILSTSVGNIGISFGLDKGTLIKVTMNNQEEYIGRALNVASRLQSAIKDKDSKPQGKVLMSNVVYDAVRHDISKTYRILSVKRELRNISGGENYRAKKLMLFEKPDRA